MNQQSLSVVTISNGSVTPGAAVKTLHLKGAAVDIPAIIIGEEGRGRERGVLPVDNPPLVACPDRGRAVWSSSGSACDTCGCQLVAAKEVGHASNHPDDGKVCDRLMFAQIGKTRAGKNKLISAREASSPDFIIAVMVTKIGFRGSNAHTGDRVGWKCRACSTEGAGMYAPATCPKCGESTFETVFAPFPAEVLARGIIAQGDAGRMGSGEQFIALIPRNTVFRTAYTGRLYGEPKSHYYAWDGQKVIAATWEERAAADLF